MHPSGTDPVLSRRGQRGIVALVVVFLAVLIVPRLLWVYIDWLWFGEVDYRTVWSTVLLTRLVLFAVTALFVTAVLGAAVWWALRTRPLLVPGPDDPLRRYRAMVTQRPRLFTLAIPAVFGLLFGLGVQGQWQRLQLFVRGGAFGTNDPEFGHDIGFYVFDLPFYRLLLTIAFSTLFLALVCNLTVHYLFGGIRLSFGDAPGTRRTGGAGAPVTTTRAARVQIAFLAGSFMALKVLAYWFDRYELLWSASKEPTFTGAGYTDINAVLPARLILVAIALVCTATFVAVLRFDDLRLPLLATALLALSSIIVGGVFPALTEQFSVRPNAADRESPYIERNIAATRQAYDIDDDRIDYIDYPGIGTRSPREIPADVTTIANIRLLDPNVLSRTFTQQQQLKNFYGFTPRLDIDRYTIDGQLGDYIVAARELSPESLSGNQTQWINRHTVYTHGNGFVAAPANRVNAAVRDPESGASSDSGYPLYTVSDIAATGSERQLIPVEQPRIYFGELIAASDPDYAIVGSADGAAPREYDTDTSQYTYSGRGGVPIGSWVNRLAFALRYGERNIVFSGAIGEESKILFDRDPRRRVERVAPWLRLDGNPYPAVVDGSIVWIVDGYTTVEHYPYAQSAALPGTGTPEAGGRLAAESVSYIRNSVKATVDAYHGTVTLYQVDEHDPVLAAWMKVFPGTVQPPEAVSEELRAHFRYPEDLFVLQRALLAKYHVDDPREFFTNNAFWSVPSDPTSDTTGAQPPYYVLVGDRDTNDPSFRLASAMVGFNREFLSSYLSVGSDPHDYGRMQILQLPTNTQTQGPQQTQNSMISDTRVASERTLLERSNRIHYGNLLTFPVADGGILYVEPLFTERLSDSASGSTFPQLSRVLVSYREPSAGGVRVGYAPTLSEALDQVLGRGTGQVATSPGGNAAPRPVPDPDTEPAPDQDIPAPPPLSGAELPPQLQEAVAELDAALTQLREAQRAGDFTAYGVALDRLQQAVDRVTALDSG